LCHVLQDKNRDKEKGLFVKFSRVATFFERIEAEPGRNAITVLLAELFSEANSEEVSILCNLSLGQLNPPYLGTQFNIAKKHMMSVVAVVLNESEDDVARDIKVAGDAGAVIAKGTWSAQQHLTVEEVFERLKLIEAVGGTGSVETKIGMLKALLQDLDPLSAKFVVRIILGELRMGFSDMTLVDALSWMVTGDKSLKAKIEHAYNICADIGRIASVLKKEGADGIAAMNVVVGIPIRPAAAERMPTAEAIIEKMGTCVAQPKLDGFRIQIHLDTRHEEPIVRFFSRNLLDMSGMFPDLKKVVEKIPVETLICEGEAIAYDPITGNFLPFQETVKRKRKHDIAAVQDEYPLKLFLFDILYLDGKSLMGLTHEERRALMFEVVNRVKTDVIQVVEEHVITTARELLDYFNANIAAGLEGLVVKKPQALYQPGRRNFNWIKLKRQEEGHLEDTLDCVILGYYAGEGKRAHFGIGAFLVGVFNEDEDRFETIAKIGTGLKDEDWRALKKTSDEIELKQQPHNVVCDSSLRPDVWVAPERICMVRADEITLSPVHSAGKTANKSGYALRFPRIMGYRPDKTAREATTVDEVRRLYEDQFASRTV
jgi:DNA ligase-1